MRSIQTAFSLMVILVFSSTVPTALSASGPIYNGNQLDYQPSIIRAEPSGGLLVVFERLNKSTLFGDLYVTGSADDGQTWSTPVAAISTTKNERHPALVQLPDQTFALFYLIDTTGAGHYRIARATSPNGLTWTFQGLLNLGWTDASEINPSVVCEEDGTLTMVYQRYSDPCYIAQSHDLGLTWDLLKTQVSDGTAALPRIAKRESDGLYCCTYQTGGSSVDIWSKTTNDPYGWTDPAQAFSTLLNSHDSQPMVLPGGMFLVTYAQQAGMDAFDVYYRTSPDGASWSEAVRVTSDTTHFDTQPHPMANGLTGEIFLTWSHQESASAYDDHDLWFDTGIPVPMALHPDVEDLSASTGGTVNLVLDAGALNANRTYLLLGTMNNTVPGIPLPGGQAVLPLNWDGFTDFVVHRLNTTLFTGFYGILDGFGRGSAQIHAPAVNPSKVGKVMHYAFLLDFPYNFASNPVAVRFVP